MRSSMMIHQMRLNCDSGFLISWGREPDKRGFCWDECPGKDGLDTFTLAHFSTFILVVLISLVSLQNNTPNTVAKSY